jgi:hypothetical protein
MAVCIDSGNKEVFVTALKARAGELSDSQNGRVAKMMKEL